MRHDASQTASPGQRVITGRLVRMGEAERDFDESFWRSIPPHRRVEMLWDMVLDALAVKGSMVNRDFKDLLAAFAAHDVHFLVVGAYAVTFHTRPRFTKDLDVGWSHPRPMRRG